MQIPKRKFHQCVFVRMPESHRHTRKTKHGEKKMEKIKKENAHTSKVWLKKEQETQTPLTKKKEETKKKHWTTAVNQ